MNIQSKFEELLSLIRLTRPKYVEGLGGGCSRQEIESAISIHPVPEALIDIYSCVIGDYSEVDCFSGMIPAYDLLPLYSIDSYIDGYQEIRMLGSDEWERSDGWEMDMIPFLYDGAGASICVRTLPNDNSVWVIPKVECSYKINTSLDKFILTAIECYKQNAYYLDLDDDMWNTDESLCVKIVGIIDPEIENYFSP
jgi:SMI1 / KNR4 family (SUKH-1)